MPEDEGFLECPKEQGKNIDCWECPIFECNDNPYYPESRR